jgi:hypothetical protein
MFRERTWKEVVMAYLRHCLHIWWVSGGEKFYQKVHIEGQFREVCHVSSIK